MSEQPSVESVMTTTATESTPPAMGFARFQLRRSIKAALDEVGYSEPTPIQAELLPPALEGYDVIGKAQTGTGKTAAFLLPILQYLDHRKPGPQALVLGPTRELVVQIATEAERLASKLPVRILAILGGEKYRGQLQGLRQGAHLVVGTPGRVIDHIHRGTLRLQSLEVVVLDEADRMLDIGFRPDIEKILRRCPRDRQTLLLSATLPSEVRRLAERYMIEPRLVDVTPPEQTAVPSIRQTYVSIAEPQKMALLLKVIEREQPRQCIIFTATKRGADQVYRFLQKAQFKAAVLHGDLPQEKRSRIMAGFREARVRLLVATDVVSRGIDVEGISHIINYDLPEDPESYIHRIGRTGRMGRDGIAIAFVTPDQGKQLTAIEILQGQLIEEATTESFGLSAAPPAPLVTESMHDVQPTPEAIGALGAADADAPASDQETLPEPVPATAPPPAISNDAATHERTADTKPEESPAMPKPIYGRPTKRYRRSL